MKDIRIIAQKSYYDCPVWLNEDRRIEQVILNGECTPAQVDSLLYGVLGYNQIQLTDSPENDLGILCTQMAENDAVMSGGLIFRDGTRAIPPQCCCGLEQWPEIISDIRKGVSPWLGHDPNPYCTFDIAGVTVHSDDLSMRNSARTDKEYPEIFTITYSWSQFEHLSKQMIADMDEFTAGPLRSRINELSPSLTDEFCRSWQHCFGWREV